MSEIINAFGQVKFSKEISQVPDEKSAGILTMFFVLYFVATGMSILIFSQQIPIIAQSMTIFFIMFFVSVTAIVFFGYVRFSTEKINFEKVFPVFAVSLVAVSLSQIIISAPLTTIPFTASTFNLTLVPDQIFAFVLYTNAAIAEEFLFCGFFQMSLMVLIRKVNIPIIDTATDIFIPLVLGTLFSVYHLFVYGTVLFVLARVFVGRVVYSLAYSYTDSLEVPILLHITNNFIAGLPLLLSAFGVILLCPVI